MPVLHPHSDTEFNNLLYLNTDKTVILKFSATWCGPCKSIAPVFEKLSNIYTNSVFVHVDVDELDKVSASYKITTMPTFVFIKDGKPVEGLKGADKQTLETLVAKYS